MADPKKTKYLTKTVSFGGKPLTLYSLDGTTWSTRRDELHEIIERHESEKMTFGEIRGQMAANKPIAPKKTPPEKYKFRPGLQKAEQRRSAEYAKRGLETPQVNRDLIDQEDEAAQDAKGKSADLAKKGVKGKGVSKDKTAIAAKMKTPPPPPKKGKAAKPAALPKQRASTKPLTKGSVKPKGKKKAA